MKEAIILAGGRGTRLRDVVKDLPKPMASVNGRPFLNFILDRLSEEKYTHIYLSIGYLADSIREYFGDNYLDLNLIYVEENYPLGTGGAVKKSMSRVLGDHALVINGDTYSDVSYAAMEDLYRDTGDIIIGVKFMKDVSRYGGVSINCGKVINFAEKNKIGPGFINVGAYILGSRFFQNYSLDVPFSLESDFLPAAVADKIVRACEKCNNFIDIGVPEDYFRAQTFFNKL